MDGTLGAGGHSAAILAEHPELERLIGIDMDPTAHEIAKRRIREAIQGGPGILSMEMFQQVQVSPDLMVVQMTFKRQSSWELRAQWCSAHA